jgi:hypothetical protein
MELSIFVNNKRGKKKMRHWLEVIVLFGTLFLAGVDAKATAVDEDNFTTETVWVDAWNTRMETLSAETAGGVCGSKQQKAIASHVNVFVREARKTLEKKLSQDDLRYLEVNAFFAGNIIRKKPECFLRQLDTLSVLKSDVKNRLK